jgi:hypothetical protein
MSAAPQTLTKLRELLAVRFPTAQRAPGRTLATGIPALDEASGGIPLSAITEMVCATPSCGGHLFFGQLLAITRATRTRVALVDGGDSFDPGSFDADLLAHVVWVRCSSTSQALAAADLLARDANLGLVLLDLRRAAAADLRRTPATQWYRLQRAVEPADLALVVATPRATVPSAQVRFELNAAHDLEQLSRERFVLTAALAPELNRQRMQAAAG